jgi:hypothetical protein
MSSHKVAGPLGILQIRGYIFSMHQSTEVIALKAYIKALRYLSIVSFLFLPEITGPLSFSYTLDKWLLPTC